MAASNAKGMLWMLCVTGGAFEEAAALLGGATVLISGMGVSLAMASLVRAFLQNIWAARWG